MKERKAPKLIKDVVEKYSMKHVLFMEFESLAPDMKALARNLKEAGCEVTIIEGVHYADNRERLMEALKTCDTIFFESQFVYWENIQNMAKVLASVPRQLKVFGSHVLEGKGNTLMQGLHECLEDEQLAAVSHHRLFERKFKFFEIDLLDNVTADSFAVEKDLKQYKIKIEKAKKAKEMMQKRELMAKSKLLRRQTEQAVATGRKVRIKELQLNDKRTANLKEGMIVDEIDCLHMDPDPHRGVWVMGVHEPIKLLNEAPYDEFEFENPNSVAVAMEILSMVRKKADARWLLTLSSWVARVVSKELKHTEGGESEVWFMLTDFLDAVGAPRRGNRNRMAQLLQRYADKHTFFGDSQGQVNKELKPYISRLEGRLAIIELEAIKIRQMRAQEVAED